MTSIVTCYSLPSANTHTPTPTHTQKGAASRKELSAIFLVILFIIGWPYWKKYANESFNLYTGLASILRKFTAHLSLVHFLSTKIPMELRKCYMPRFLTFTKHPPPSHCNILES